MKRKNKVTGEVMASAQASTITRMFSTLPHVVEHLAVRMYDDEKPRQTGRIILDVVGSMYRVIAKDVDSGMQLVVYMPSLDDCLLSLELLLGADEAPWEPDPYAKIPKSKNSKK